MDMQIPEWVKPAAWGAVVGAIALAITGFSTGWVVMSGTAQEMAETQKEKAVIAALTPICVAQFKNELPAERTTQLAALEEESFWGRGDYVEKQGWATMPGGDKPNDEVAEACATEVLKLGKESADTPNAS